MRLLSGQKVKEKSKPSPSQGLQTLHLPSRGLSSHWKALPAMPATEIANALRALLGTSTRRPWSPKANPDVRKMRGMQ